MFLDRLFLNNDFNFLFSSCKPSFSYFKVWSSLLRRKRSSIFYFSISSSNFFCISLLLNSWFFSCFFVIDIEFFFCNHYMFIVTKIFISLIFIIHSFKIRFKLYRDFTSNFKNCKTFSFLTPSKNKSSSFVNNQGISSTIG